MSTIPAPVAACYIAAVRSAGELLYLPTCAHHFAVLDWSWERRWCGVCGAPQVRLTREEWEGGFEQ